MEEKIEKGQQIGQLPKRDVLTGNEQFPFQEDRENGSITPNALKSFISSGKGGYMSYITEYNVSIHHPSSGIDGSNRYTLEGAIVQVPEDIRMVGLKVSFLNNSGLVETWEFAGGVFENIENWKSNEDKLTDIRDEAISKIKEVESDAISNFSSQRVTPDMLSESTKQFINASGGGTINNLADDEDLVSVDKGESLSVLKFADRAYNPGIYVGMGYKILRRNIIDGKNILTQDMVNQPHTIYMIQYDFDLDGKTINLPRRTKILFNGGSLSNGKINSKAHIENFGVDGNFTFKDVQFGAYSAVMDLSSCILPTIEKDGNYGYDLSFVLNTINKWKADNHYNLNLKIVFPWSTLYFIKETIYVDKNVSIDFNGSILVPINSLDFCFSVSSQNRMYDDTNTGKVQGSYIKNFVINDSFGTRSKFMFVADNHEISNVKAIKLSNTLLTYGGYIEDAPNDVNYIDFKNIHDIELSNEVRKFDDIVIGKGDGCRLDGIHGCKIKIEGSQGFVASNCVNCGFELRGSQGVIINHHDEEAKGYILTNSSLTMVASKIWKHNRNLITIADDTDYMLYGNKICALSKLVLNDVIIAGSLHLDFGLIPKTVYDIFWDNAKCDTAPKIILNNARVKSSSYREFFNTAGECLLSNVSYTDICQPHGYTSELNSITAKPAWFESDLAIRDLSGSKYDVFYLYDDMRKAGVKLNEVVFNATPKPFEEQKYIATICLSKDFSDIHYGTLLFYHKNKDVIDYKYSLGLDNFEFHTVNEYWDNGEDGYLFFDTGNALNNRIFKTLSSSLDKYNECSKYIKNGINCIAYLREIPQYGEWIIGDMVVVDGNTYAYNGKLWLDASGTPSSVARSGATGERPQNVLAGFCYFDKTINKPVWWNGSSWTDASGATV